MLYRHADDVQRVLGIPLVWFEVADLVEAVQIGAPLVRSQAASAGDQPRLLTEHPTPPGEQPGQHHADRARPQRRGRGRSA